MNGQLPKPLVLASWLVVILVCGWQALVLTPMITEVTRLLPNAGAAGQRLTLLQSTVAARLLLLGLAGGSEVERAEVSRQLAATLRASGQFVRVANGETASMAKEVRVLFAHRYLLSPAIEPERFDEAGLRRALAARLEEMRSPMSPVLKELLPFDPTGEAATLISLWQGGIRQPEVRRGVWFSPDGERALLLVETVQSGFDPKIQGAILDVIEDAFRQAKDARDIHLLLSGPGALAAQSERTIRTEAALLSLGSTSLIALILVLAYRSPRILLLSPLPLLSAVVVGTAAIGFIYGGIHGITLGFAATLLGVAIDYPVLLFSHLRPDRTATETMRRIWPTMRLCVATTSIGYAAMLSTGFEGMAQLAIFSITGSITAALATRWLLPSLLPDGWAPRRAEGPDSMAPLLRFRQRPAPVIALGTLVFAALLIALAVDPPAWQADLAALSPVPRAQLATDARLRADLGAPEAGQMLFIRGADREQVLEGSEAALARIRPLIATGALAGFDAPSLYLPSAATQRTRQRALPPSERLDHELTAALDGMPFRRDLFRQFLADVEAARTGPPVTAEDLAKTPIASRLAALLSQGGDHWTGVVLLTGVRDPSAIAAAVAPLNGVEFVDLRAETNEMMNSFRDGALTRLSLAAVLLTAIVVYGVRSLRQTVAVLLPVAIAVALDLAVLSWANERLTLFHLVSLLVVVGIGIDYGLFFSLNDEGDGRGRTLHALLVCSSSTAAGFFMLWLSSLPVLSAIGQTVTVGVGTAFVGALLLTRPQRGERSRSSHQIGCPVRG